jgi:hypothetical protein
VRVAALPLLISMLLFHLLPGIPRSTLIGSQPGRGPKKESDSG